MTTYRMTVAECRRKPGVGFDWKAFRSRCQDDPHEGRDEVEFRLPFYVSLNHPAKAEAALATMAEWSDADEVEVVCCLVGACRTYPVTSTPATFEGERVDLSFYIREAVFTTEYVTVDAVAERVAQKVPDLPPAAWPNPSQANWRNWSSLAS